MGSEPCHGPENVVAGLCGRRDGFRALSGSMAPWLTVCMFGTFGGLPSRCWQQSSRDFSGFLARERPPAACRFSRIAPSVLTCPDTACARSAGASPHPGQSVTHHATNVDSRKPAFHAGFIVATPKK